MSPASAGAGALSRRALIARLFPEGVPRLWCPPLTHYDTDGAIDRERCAAHLAFVTRWSRGLLAPGSTGDGWELTSAESRDVTDLALAEAARLGVHVLVGALHPDSSEAARVIRDTMARLDGGWTAGGAVDGGGSAPTGSRPTPGSVGGLWAAGAACGFAVCPPRGEGLAQAELDGALSELLSLGAPVALYQLPQVTQNEMSPALVAVLARRFSTFVLFKDTSGVDRVASAASGSGAGAALDLGGVFLVRGAEGDYAAHLRDNGGAYDGLLLSTANSFGAELAAIIEFSESGRREEAVALSNRLSSLVVELFGIVESVAAGNAFANAGKAADHFYAYGPRAHGAPPPRLHAGMTLPPEVLDATGDALRRHDLLPRRGYLE